MTYEIRQRRRQAPVAPCPCCERTTALTFHHLIPKKLHRRSRFRKHFTREQLNQGMEMCRQCHSGIHARYNEMALFLEFSEPEALLADPALKKYFAWVGKQRIRA
jgi:hypothetical protein